LVVISMTFIKHFLCPFLLLQYDANKCF
jgi:hypothetical protein